MNGNLPVGVGMHVFAMICDLIHVSGVLVCALLPKGRALLPGHCKPLHIVAGKMFLLDPS